MTSGAAWYPSRTGEATVPSALVKSAVCLRCRSNAEVGLAAAFTDDQRLASTRSMISIDQRVSRGWRVSAEVSWAEPGDSGGAQGCILCRAT